MQHVPERLVARLAVVGRAIVQRDELVTLVLCDAGLVTELLRCVAAAATTLLVLTLSRVQDLRNRRTRAMYERTSQSEFALYSDCVGLNNSEYTYISIACSKIPGIFAEYLWLLRVLRHLASPAVRETAYCEKENKHM